jgi:hypothetical protein
MKKEKLLAWITPPIVVPALIVAAVTVLWLMQ